MKPSASLPETLPETLADTLTISREQFEGEFVGAKASGFDLAPLYQEYGITEDFLNNPHARIPYGQMILLRQAVCKAMNDENVGFLDTPSPWGTLAYLCRAVVTSRSIKGAIHRYHQFHQMFRPSMACTVKEQGSLAYIRFDVTLRKGLDGHCFIENSLLFLLSMLLWLADRPYVPRRIDYCFPEPDYTRDYPGNYATLVPCEYRFGQPCTQVVIDRTLLTEPVKRKADELNFFINNSAYYLAEQNLAAVSLADRVRRIISSSSGMNASMSQVARLLNMPETTLRRHLRAEGHPFKVLKENLRKELALHYLFEKGLSVLDVAALLGYSEASAFSRAFKQWTGYAPQHYPKETRPHK